MEDTLLPCKVEATVKWYRVSIRCKKKNKEKKRKPEKRDIDRVGYRFRLP